MIIEKNLYRRTLLIDKKTWNRFVFQKQTAKNIMNLLKFDVNITEDEAEMFENISFDHANHYLRWRFGDIEKKKSQTQNKI